MLEHARSSRARRLVLEVLEPRQVLSITADLIANSALISDAAAAYAQQATSSQSGGSSSSSGNSESSQSPENAAMTFLNEEMGNFKSLLVDNWNTGGIQIGGFSGWEKRMIIANINSERDAVNLRYDSRLQRVNNELQNLQRAIQATNASIAKVNPNDPNATLQLLYLQAIVKLEAGFQQHLTEDADILQEDRADMNARIDDIIQSIQQISTSSSDPNNLAFYYTSDIIYV